MTDRAKADEMARQIRDMPEGEGAGPDAPETIEPITGHPGPGGHGPHDRRSRADWGNLRKPEWGARSGADDAHMDAAGATGFATWVGLWIFRRPLGLARRLLRRAS